MRYAIIESGGKQFRVSEGDTIRVPSIDAEVGNQIEIGRVLFVGGEAESKLGSPLLDGSKVVAQVLEHGRAKKIVVYKFKRRKQYRRKQGHRQNFTKVRIEAIHA